MPLRRRLRASALLACLAAASSASEARGEATNGQTDSNASNVAAARRHYERAREDYGHGAYREAIAELDAAHALDPSAKDLVFNLGVVHEKLADIDDALHWFQLYTTMNVTAAERGRADAYIQRLEGAKKELAQTPASSSLPSAGSQELRTEPRPSQPILTGVAPASPGNGRIDAATISAAGVAGAALVFGGIMAAKAMADRPANGFVTGQDGTYANLAGRVDRAHTEAVIADIAFGVSLATGITATVLFFGRSRDSAKASTTSTSNAGSTRFSVTPLSRGATLTVQGFL